MLKREGLNAWSAELKNSGCILRRGTFSTLMWFFVLLELYERRHKSPYFQWESSVAIYSNSRAPVSYCSWRQVEIRGQKFSSVMTKGMEAKFPSVWSSHSWQHASSINSLETGIRRGTLETLTTPTFNLPIVASQLQRGIERIEELKHSLL